MDAKQSSGNIEPQRTAETDRVAATVQRAADALVAFEKPNDPAVLELVLQRP